MNVLIILIISCCQRIMARTTYGRKPGRYQEETYIPDHVSLKTPAMLASGTQLIKPYVQEESSNPENKNLESHKVSRVGNKILKITSSLHSDRNEKYKLMNPYKKFHHLIKIIPKDEFELLKLDSTRTFEDDQTDVKTDLKELLKSEIKSTVNQNLDKSETNDNKIKITSSLHSDEEKAELQHPNKKFHHIIEISKEEFETSKPDSKSQSLKEIHPTDATTDFKEILKGLSKISGTAQKDSNKFDTYSNKIKTSLHSDVAEKSELKYPDKKFHHAIEISKDILETPKPDSSQSFNKINKTAPTADFNEPLEDSSVVAGIMGHNSGRISETELGNLIPGTESDDFEGSGEEFSSNDFANEEKTARAFGLFPRDSAPVCTTPRNETGRCLGLRHCLLNDALNNFNNFLQYLCLIRGIRVGICCPDNPVIEITNEENDTISNLDTDIKQPPEGCGLNVKTRIVGGTVSVPHEWSWMVALMRRNRFYCGGVIINNWYVLTAAHCVLGVNVKDITVRLGEYNFNTKNGQEEDLSVAEIKRHAQFVTLTFQHDIALLKLRRSINYSKFVGSICLPAQRARDYSDVKGTVVGWGTVSFGGAASPVLRQVTIPIWKNEDCDRTYRLESINDSFLCAGALEKGEDACQGDSGGPLMAINERGRWEVIGIVSWGRRCGDPTYPGVYTRITTYTDWINQNIT